MEVIAEDFFHPSQSSELLGTCSLKHLKEHWVIKYNILHGIYFILKQVLQILFKNVKCNKNIWFALCSKWSITKQRFWIRTRDNQQYGQLWFRYSHTIRQMGILTFIPQIKSTLF